MIECTNDEREKAAITLFRRSDLVFGIGRVLPSTEINTNIWMTLLNVAPLHTLFIRIY